MGTFTIKLTKKQQDLVEEAREEQQARFKKYGRYGVEWKKKDYEEWLKSK